MATVKIIVYDGGGREGFGFNYIFNVNPNDTFGQLRQYIIDEMYRYWMLPSDYEIIREITLETTKQGPRFTRISDKMLDEGFDMMSIRDMIRNKILMQASFLPGNLGEIEINIRYSDTVKSYIEEYDSKLLISHKSRPGMYGVDFNVKYAKNKYWYPIHFYISYTYNGTVHDMIDIVLQYANRKYDTLLYVTDVSCYDMESNLNTSMYDLRTNPTVEAYIRSSVPRRDSMTISVNVDDYVGG